MHADRGYALKLAAAAGLVAGLTAYCGWRGGSINPELWRCLAEPERWHGAPLRASGKVAELRPGGFLLVQANGAAVEVRGRAEVGVGQTVEVGGRFDRGILLNVERVREIRPHSRRWLEVLSVAVLAAVVLNLLRHFSFRPEVLRAGN